MNELRRLIESEPWKESQKAMTQIVDDAVERIKEIPDNANFRMRIREIADESASKYALLQEHYEFQIQELHILDILHVAEKRGIVRIGRNGAERCKPELIQSESWQEVLKKKAQVVEEAVERIKNISDTENYPFRFYEIALGAERTYDALQEHYEFEIPEFSVLDINVVLAERGLARPEELSRFTVIDKG